MPPQGVIVARRKKAKRIKKMDPLDTSALMALACVVHGEGVLPSQQVTHPRDAPTTTSMFLRIVNMYKEREHMKKATQWAEITGGHAHRPSAGDEFGGHIHRPIPRRYVHRPTPCRLAF
tara:strand:- start:226 stop:582 length:357 start_codon:yes stop_codon:yes gene_type:complete